MTELLLNLGICSVSSGAKSKVILAGENEGFQEERKLIQEINHFSFTLQHSKALRKLYSYDTYWVLVISTDQFQMRSLSALVYIEDITQWREDMNFIFELQKLRHR